MQNLMLACLATLTFGAQAPVQPPAGATPPTVRQENKAVLDLSGAMSHIRVARQVVVRDVKTWAALWAEHTGSKTIAMTAVDFKRYDVVAVFAGQRNTGGFSAAIGAIKRNGNKAAIEVVITKPGPHDIVPMVITYPFAIKAVPKLPPTVTFETEERARG